jgi:hypothetical protein
MLADAYEWTDQEPLFVAATAPVRLRWASAGHVPIPAAPADAAIPLQGVSSQAVTVPDSCAAVPAAEKLEPNLSKAAATLVANTVPDAPVVSYEYATGPWLQELRRSFGTRARARRQCALDWPRMRVRDERSLVRRALAVVYDADSDIQVYFANQAALARPFGLLVAAYRNLVVTQCSAQPPLLVLRADGTLLLRKDAIAWEPAHPETGDLSPLFRLRVSVDVGPATVIVAFRPVHL